jgi:hypothetical protein
MSNGLNTAEPRRRLVWWRIPRFIALVYSLPVWAYYVAHLRSLQLLLGWLLLLAANFAMFRYGAAIDSGRVRPGILLLYGTLFTSLMLIGLRGLLQLF